MRTMRGIAILALLTLVGCVLVVLGLKLEWVPLVAVGATIASLCILLLIFGFFSILVINIQYGAGERRH